ncbi:MAG: DNA-processing protein DprA [Geobacteraceae bacterium]|nr:DNA-processing protein DprA [Geobacteraceae bacterium]
MGNKTFRRLVEHFGSPAKVLSSSESELSTVKGIYPSVVSSILGHDYRQFAENEYAALHKSGARVITFQCRDFPCLLLQIPDPPPFIYVKGELKAHETAIAIVGSRRASPYGLEATYRFARELSSHGIAVVSGMARGVDTSAHRGALSGGGRSIGVLGCGIDVVYPAENRSLFTEMVEKGALVSEFPLGTKPVAENFPRRNRIISGFSAGVLVIEAAEGSGSLITAQCALDQGRDIYAVPGSINSPLSRGSNRLIKQGAKLVERVEDILEELPARANSVGKAPLPPSPCFSPQEASVYSLLSPVPLHIDEIAAKCALTASEVSAILLRLELSGAISQLPGKHFSTP